MKAAANVRITLVSSPLQYRLHILQDRARSLCEILEAMLSDTSPKAREIYDRRLKEMTPSERVQWGVALWTAGDSLQRAALRRDNPHATEAEIVFQLAVSRFGFDLARKAYRKP